MYKLRLALITLISTLAFSNAFAHALWIETKSNGKAGTAHEVKVFYGEYATNERDSLTKWYSDVPEFSLWLTAPGKEKIALKKEKGTNYFVSNFIPEKDGVYVLTVIHEAKELGGTTKYEFSAHATVNIGKTKITFDPTSIKNPVKVSVKELKSYKVNDAVTLTASLNNKPLVNKAVSIFSPEGWSKEYLTNEQGEINFSPLWPGLYVIEASNYEKKQGEHYGKNFDAVWQGATSTLQVD